MLYEDIFGKKYSRNASAASEFGTTIDFDSTLQLMAALDYAAILS
jgi:hypothetical protein